MKIRRHDTVRGALDVADIEAVSQLFTCDRTSDPQVISLTTGWGKDRMLRVRRHLHELLAKDAKDITVVPWCTPHKPARAGLSY